MAKRITSEDIKKAAEPVVKEHKVFERGDYLSTGCTLLNLALSNKCDGGVLPGHYYHWYGDSSGAKTFFSSACLAESSLNTKYSGYNLIYDNTEDGNLMDLVGLFGSKTAQRVQPPRIDDEGLPLFSSTIESFYYVLDDWLSKDTPCIYVLDSIDTLTCDADESKFTEAKEAFEKGKEAKGSFGMGRAKQNSEKLRKVMNKLTRTGSILIVVSQTRQNTSPMSFGKTYAGGEAIKFYATAQIFSKPKDNIKKTVDGNDILIGKNIEIAVKKNRITGYEHIVHTAVYPAYGIADLPSVIAYLLDTKHWGKEGRSIVAPEFDFKGLEDTLISKLEDENKENELRMIAEGVWNRLIEKASPKWKKRYE